MSKLDYEKMPGHWLLSSLGKTVLRPGGLQLTQSMLQHLQITAEDYVVEFAPRLGVTAKLTLQSNPNYIAIEQNEQAASKVRSYLQKANQQCLIGTAERTGLPDASATIVYGEAMLTMQSAKQKDQIISEAKRILKKGGKYAIHEMSLTPAVEMDGMRENIRKDLVEAIRVNATPLLEEEWKAALKSHGFEIDYVKKVPMHLLHPKRLIEDEGLLGVAKIAKNILTKPAARKHVLKIRHTFMKYEKYLQGICIVATLKED
ncbi:methyltransferase domain-containing protein [Metasolibacillus meyeri]|uniref:Methyltransferase domain-containing protein n=1 Tax=Metasolibacillus meyeri TaxID=1071052 RepID=A0AAW9NSM6_9BACL|nr:methyltransferase domain-containing protein [Metasolibacillus meyeri]MEC1179023.1 methyltransferase domain-containing protein [Metasolibacillus meyeri]